VNETAESSEADLQTLYSKSPSTGIEYKYFEKDMKQ
jgi:hypothetical protein